MLTPLKYVNPFDSGVNVTGLELNPGLLTRDLMYPPIVVFDLRSNVEIT